MTKNTPLAIAMFITFVGMNIPLSMGYYAMFGAMAWLVIIPTSIICGVGFIICYLILTDEVSQ